MLSFDVPSPGIDGPTFLVVLAVIVVIVVVVVMLVRLLGKK